MNVEQADLLGAKPLEPTLAAIEALADKAQIASFLGNTSVLGAGLFSITVQQDDKDAQGKIQRCDRMVSRSRHPSTI